LGLDLLRDLEQVLERVDALVLLSQEGVGGIEEIRESERIPVCSR
jgi:hypothetical protein